MQSATLASPYLPLLQHRDHSTLRVHHAEMVAVVGVGAALPHELATLLKRRSMSGAQRVKSWVQKLKRGFLMSSMKEMSRPCADGSWV